MKKQNQSLLDFINFVPLQSVRAPINHNETKTLMEIWNGDRDVYGNILVPQTADPTTIASLTTKGLVKSKLNGFSIGNNRLIEITKTGKELVKTLILHNETSAFEKKANNDKGESWFQRALWKFF